MSNDPKLSRRALVGAIAVVPALSASAFAAKPDDELIALGQQREAICAALDRAGEHDEAMSILDRIDDLTAAIVATPAKTLQGLHVKARATAWALEHDLGLLNPEKEPSINDRVAASIVRDLLKLGATEV